MRFKTLLAATFSLAASISMFSPGARVLAATPAAPTASTSPAPEPPTSTPAAKTEAAEGSADTNLEPSKEKYKQEYQEIENFLGEIETQWNAHNLDNVMKFYADDYINNDGLDKKAVQELTKDFWKTYPDAKSYSKTKQIRIEGKFATVDSRDRALGTTAKEMPAIQAKGVLTSISEGQLYLKKLNKDWKIVGDRIDYEKVRVAFGLAKDLETSFIAPEQVKSGQEYSARLNVDLPSDLIAVGSITSEPLQYPQPSNKDFWRPIDNRVLERIIHANTSNHNELLMATIAITDRSRSNLRGLTYLTRRLNVVPEGKDFPTEEKSSDKSETAASVDGELMMQGPPGADDGKESDGGAGSGAGSGTSGGAGSGTGGSGAGSGTGGGGDKGGDK